MLEMLRSPLKGKPNPSRFINEITFSLIISIKYTALSFWEKVWGCGWFWFCIFILVIATTGSCKVL